MRDFQSENLSHDAIHGYIPFVSQAGLRGDEVSERQIIDHPWVQRLRQIHQLQTAWWVFPTAEHTRFQHVVGVMHLGSRAAAALYDSLREVCPDVPSRGYVESLLRMGGLLHDVGHGPFGHFFDDHFLRAHGHSHETLGSAIICGELGDLLRRIRRNPNSRLEPGEQLDPQHIAFLITRPQSTDSARAFPRWLELLRGLFSGIYTVDNMDFVLRDAFMSGYNARAFDLDRLLHYSFFTAQGLTIHSRGMAALVQFMSVRADLFRTIYFHRTVRAIDLTLTDLFADSKTYLFPGNPLEHLDQYRRFTEWSLLVDVGRWGNSSDPRQRELGQRWQAFLDRKIPWKMVCHRHLVFAAGQAERSSIFSHADFVERQLRANLPASLAGLPLRVDLARHIHRPDTRGPRMGQNFLFDPARGEPRPLTDDQLFRQLPLSHRICRIYAHDDAHAPQLAEALDGLIGPGGSDDLTNM
ncbi:MAG: HD domain-containing protein [Planctomycetia bacterium]|nr:HD domain-containing protein [Planctomycetia bacterium]